MKCTQRVIVREARRKGSGKPYTKIRPAYGPEESKGEVCGGRIIIGELDAVDEPDWGATYARLSIIYTCERCGLTPRNDKLPTDSIAVRAVVQAFLDTTE